MSEAAQKTADAVEESKEVAVASSSTDLQIADDLIDELSQDAGIGQDFSAEDLVIPTIGIVQSLSPQRQKDKDAYIEGAQEGMIYIRNKLIDGDKGISVIPCLYRMHYLEWAPRDSKDGGGLVANHFEDDTKFINCEGKGLPAGVKYDPKVHGHVNEKGKHVTKDGNIIVPTAEYFVFVVSDDGTYSRAILRMANTHLRSAKQWNMDITEAFATDAEGGLIRKKPREGEKVGAPISAPIFYYVYRLRAVPVSNNLGSWFKWHASFDTVENGDKTRAKTVLFDVAEGRAIYDDAKLFREAVNSDDVKVEEHEMEAYDSAAPVEVDDDAPM